MSTYKIEYNGKIYWHSGDDCEEALDKFSNRKVFGSPLIHGYLITRFDAHTCGVEWCQAETRGHNSIGGTAIISCEREGRS